MELTDISVFECPYTWDIAKFVRFANEDNEAQDRDEDDEVFLIKLIKHVMLLCEGVIKLDFEAAEISLKKLELMRPDIKKENLENGQISTKVVNHVVDATIYLSLQKMKQDERAKKMKDRVELIAVENDLELSSLCGCKSAAWSKYYEEGAKRAVIHVRDALTYNRKCGLWWFICGLNLRRERRTVGDRYPSNEERECFYTAYKISKHPVFGTALALNYRECRKSTEALQLYEEMMKKDIKHITCLCKLSLGFLRLKKIENAEMCLKKAEMINPKASIFLHYKGIFLEKMNKIDEAKYYLSEAGKTGNFRADMNYAELIYKSHSEENMVDFFKELFTRYDGEYEQKQLWLNIAIHYYEVDNDLENALLNFKWGVSVNPTCGLIKNYYNKITRKRMNLYTFFEKTLFPMVRNGIEKLSPSAKEAFDTLNEYCDLTRQLSCVTKETDELRK